MSVERATLLLAAGSYSCPSMLAVLVNAMPDDSRSMAAVAVRVPGWMAVGGGGATERGVGVGAVMCTRGGAGERKSIRNSP